jgi:plastocyanin
VIKALNHPSAGVRKNAVSVLPKTEASLKAILDANLLNDLDLNSRKAVFLAIAEMPASPEVSQLLLNASQDEKNTADSYLPQAMFAAVITHPSSFNGGTAGLTEIDKPDSLLSLEERLSKSLLEEQYSLDRRSGIPFPPKVAGKEIRIKATLSKADEPLDGVILAQGNKQNGYSLYIQNSRIYWLVRQNGETYQAVSRGNLPGQQFVLEASLEKNGSMLLSINEKQVATTMAPGLFSSDFDQERVRIGNDNMGANQVGDYQDRFYFRGRMNARSSYVNLKVPTENPEEEVTEKIEEQSETKNLGSVTIKMGVVPNELKYDKTSFTVKAGQQVTIDFVNNDFMQHNLLIGKSGSLEIIGKAGDQLARDPNGVTMNFIPKIPEVLFATPLVNPEGAESLVFTAPTTPGEYPYLCTVPGHWRIMNGIMIVE